MNKSQQTTDDAVIVFSFYIPKPNFTHVSGLGELNTCRYLEQTTHAGL